MGVPVFVLGNPGSGKSYAIKNFNPDEITIISVVKPFLPFKKKFNVIRPSEQARYNEIIKIISKADKKVYVIDDSQALMALEMFARAKEVGYGKFTDIAQHFYYLLNTIMYSLPDDIIVYLLHHIDIDDNGNVKPKTVGKMLDQQLSLDGLCNIVLMCKCDANSHWFETQSDGTNGAKSPEDMFEFKIPNDLKAVDTAIREYYGI